MRLSPGGRWLAWMAPHERRLNVFVRDLAGGGELDEARSQRLFERLLALEAATEAAPR